MGQINDDFIFIFNEICERFDIILVKHNVIKATASIYDALGLLNPFAVQMKIFFIRFARQNMTGLI